MKALTGDFLPISNAYAEHGTCLTVWIYVTHFHCRCEAILAKNDSLGIEITLFKLVMHSDRLLYWTLLVHLQDLSPLKLRRAKKKLDGNLWRMLAGQ